MNDDGNHRRHLCFGARLRLSSSSQQRGMAVTGWRAVIAGSTVVLALSVGPAMADDYWWRFWHWHHGPEWQAIHYGIYRLNNRGAYLEANPEIDEAYKAPIITGNRADIRALQATLDPPRWKWGAPCCYGRKPIHIP